MIENAQISTGIAMPKNINSVLNAVSHRHSFSLLHNTGTMKNLMKTSSMAMSLVVTLFMLVCTNTSLSAMSNAGEEFACNMTLQLSTSSSNNFCEGESNALDRRAILQPVSGVYFEAQPLLCLSCGSASIDSFTQSGATGRVVTAAQGLAPGTYDLRIYGSYDGTAPDESCLDSLDFSFVVNPSPVITTTVGSVCEGDTIDLESLVSSNPAYTSIMFNYSGSGTSIPNNTVTITKDTMYDVIVEDANGCMSTSAVSIDALPKPIAQNENVTICAGDDLKLDTVGSLDPSQILTFYDKNPSNGSAQIISEVQSMLSDGDRFWYILESTDGCLDTANIDVTVTDLPVLEFAQYFSDTTTFCENIDFIDPIRRISFEQTPNLLYSYQFNSGEDFFFLPEGMANQVIFAIPGIPSGNYSVIATATDTITGCSNDTTLTFNVLPEPNVTITSTYNQPEICQNGAPFTLTGSPAGGDFTMIAEQCPADVSVTAEAEEINFTFDNAYDRDAFLADFPDTIHVNAGVPLVYIFDGLAMSPLTYVRTPFISGDLSAINTPDENDVLSAIGCTQASTVVFDPSNANFPNFNIGDEEVIYTYTDGNGCEASDTFRIRILATPEITGRDTIVCEGETVDLSTLINGDLTGTTLSYGTDLNTLGNNAIVSAAGTYFVEATYPGNSCSDTAQIVVTTLTVPSITAADAAGCLGDTVFMSSLVTGANGANLRYKSLGGTFSTSDTLVIMSDSTIVVRAGLAGCVDLDTIQITLNPKPQADNEIVTICFGENVKLDTVGSLDPSQNLAFFTNGAATVATGTNQSPTSTTNYFYILTNGDGCSDTARVRVLVEDLPMITGRDTAVCIGEIVDLASLITGDTTGLTLTYGDALNNLSSVSTVSGAGTYFVEGVDRSTGCIDTAMYEVTENAIPAITADDAAGCFGDTIFLESLVTGANGANLRYKPLGGSFSKNDTLVIMSDSTIVVRAGLLGCLDFDTIQITLYPSPIAVAENIAICDGESIKLDTVGSLDPSQDLTFFDLNPTNTNAAVIPALQTPTIGNTNFWYILTNTDGCSDTSRVRVTVGELPTFSYSPTSGDTIDICENEGPRWIQINLAQGKSYEYSLISGPQNADLANDFEITTGNNNSQRITANEGITPGQYDIKVTATVDATGCMAMDTMVFIIKPLPTVDILLSVPESPVIEICTNDDPITLTGTPAGGTFCLIVDQCPTDIEIDAHAETITFEFETAEGRAAFFNAFNPLYINKGVQLEYTTPGLPPTSTLVYTRQSPVFGALTSQYFPTIQDVRDATGCQEGSIVTYDPSKLNIDFGKDTVVYKYTDPITMCDANDTIYFKILLTPDVTGRDTTVCEGEIVDLRTLLNGDTTGTTLVYSGGSPIVTVAGTYDITATYPGNACSDTAQITVTTLPVPSITATDAAGCLGDTVFMRSLVSGANGTNLSFKPLGGMFTPRDTLVITSDSTIVVRAGLQGCADFDTIRITLFDSPIASFLRDTICEGESIQLDNVGTINAGESRTYYDINPLNTASQEVSSIQSPIATQTFWYILQNTDGCTATNRIIVTVDESPKLVSIDSTVCDGASICLNDLVRDTSNTSSTIEVFENGSLSTPILCEYEMTTALLDKLLTTDNVNSCQGSTSFIVTSTSEEREELSKVLVPEPFGFSRGIIFRGSNVLLTIDNMANAVYISKATFGSTCDLPTQAELDNIKSQLLPFACCELSPSVTTSYVAIATNLEGCSDTTSFTINVNPLPEVTILRDGEPAGFIEICQSEDPFVLSGSPSGGTITFDNNVCPVSYFSRNDDGFGQFIYFTFDNAGDSTSFVGLYPSIELMGITWSPATGALPSPEGPLQVAYERPLNGGVNNDINVAGISDLLILDDMIGNVIGCFPDGDGATFFPALHPPFSSYRVTYSYTDDNSCPGEAGISVNVLGVPSITGRDTMICNGNEVDLSTLFTGNTVGSIVTYGTDINNLGNTVSVTPNQTTTYIVQTLIGTNGCTDTTSITVNVVDQPNITATDLTVCPGDSVDLSTLITGAEGLNVRYKPVGSGSFGQESMVEINSDTAFAIFAGLNGCLDRDTIHINLHPLPSAPNQLTAICLGESIRLDTIGELKTFGSQFLTFFNLFPANANAQVISPLRSPDMDTTYWVQISNAEGCHINRRISLTVNPLPQIRFVNGIDSLTICFDDISRDISLSNIGGAFSYELLSGPSGANISDFTIAGNTNKITANADIAAGTYDIKVTATLNGTNCMDMDTLVFIILPKPDLSIDYVAPLCLSDDPVTLSLTNPTMGGFGGFCANGVCPEEINIDMNSNLSVKFSFTTSDIQDAFIEKYHDFTIALDNGGSVTFVKAQNYGSYIEYSSGLEVGKDIAMEQLPDISEIATAINCGELLSSNVPCPFDVSTDASGVAYTFLLDSDGQAFADAKPTMSIEDRILTLERTEPIAFGPQQGLIVIYTYTGAPINDIQAVRATRCLDYPAPIFDPVCWGVGKHEVFYKHETEDGCFYMDSTIIEVLSSPLITGNDDYICEGDMVKLHDYIDTAAVSSSITQILWGTALNNLVNVLTDETEVTVLGDVTYYFSASVSSNPGCIDTAVVNLLLIEDLEITLDNGDPIAEHYCANDAPIVLKGFPAGGKFCVLGRNCPFYTSVTEVDDDKDDILQVKFCFEELNKAQEFYNGNPSFEINNLTYSTLEITVVDLSEYGGSDNSYCAVYTSGKKESQVLSNLHPTVDDFLQLIDCEGDDDVVFDPAEFGPGFHDVVYKLDNHGNCATSDTVTICVLDVPQITGSDTEICRGDTVNLNDLITEDISLYVIDYGTAADSLVSPDVTMTYILTATYATSSCSDTTAITVTVNDQPDITGMDTEACKGDSVNLADFIVGQTIGEVTYGFSFGNYPAPITQKVKVDSDLTLYIQDRVLETGCVDTAVIHIKYNELPLLQGTNGQMMPMIMPICNGESVDLDTTVIDARNLPGDIVFYTDRDLTEQIGSVVTPLEDTWFYMKKTTDKGCMNTDSIMVMVFPLPELTIVPELTTSSICLGHDDITDLQYTFSPVDGSVTYTYEYVSGPGALNLFTISDDPILSQFGPGGIDNYITATPFLPQGTHSVMVTATQKFTYQGIDNVTFEKYCTNQRLIQFHISDLIIVQKPEVFFCEGETFDLNTVIADSVQGLGKLYFFDDKTDVLTLITTGPVVSQEGTYYYDVHDKDGGCPTRCIIPLWQYDQNGGDVSAPNGDKVIKQCVGESLHIILENEIENKRWIVCDENGLILKLFNSTGYANGSPLDVSDLGVGRYFVSQVSYVNSPAGIAIGQNVNDINGCFDMSNNVTLEIESLNITADKNDFEICTGEATSTQRKVSFSPTGSEVSYSFELLSSPLPGDFADFFSIVPDRSMTINDDVPTGLYTVEVTGLLSEYGCTSSITVTMTVADCSTICDDLQIVSFTDDITVDEGGDAIFTVDAIGTNLNYQWQEFISGSYVNIPLENGSELIINSVTISDDQRMFRVVISDDKNCIIYSPKATLNVNPLPDLTPIITVTPNIIVGQTCDIAVTVKVIELKGVDTDGLITVLIPKDPRLSFTFDDSMTEIGVFSDQVDNSVWTYSGSNFLFHEFTTTSVIGANASSVIGFNACYDPENTRGDATMTSQIVEGSGGEIRFDNNVDAEKIIYTFN